MAPHSGATTQPHLESGGQMGGRTLYSGGGWGVTGGGGSHKGATPSEQRIYLFLTLPCVPYPFPKPLMLFKSPSLIPEPAKESPPPEKVRAEE